MVRKRNILQFLLAATVTLLGPAAGVAAQSAEQRRACDLGDRIDWGSEPSGASVGWGRASAVITATPAQVMAIVTDYSNYRRFMPHFQQSRVLSRRGSNAMVYMEALIARGAATLWAQMRIYERAARGETRIIEGRMVQGNMEHFVARWEITPIDQGTRTLVDFRILVDPDMPLPAALFTSENAKAARDTLRALRRRIAEAPAGAQVAQNR